MNARQFNKRVEVWETTSISNGFGGYTVGETLVTSSWAKVETLQPGRANNVTQFGIADGTGAVLFSLRVRKDLVYNEEIHFLKYRSRKYTITSAPTDPDFDGKLILFIGKAETTKSNTANP